MLLGTKARYAVMAMVELASRGEGSTVPLAQLAESQEIPLPYLEQIFAQLRREGLVAAQRGPGGGYALSRTAGSIPIAEIIKAMDEPIHMTRCEKHSEKGCMARSARCATHDLWDGLGRQIEGYLSNITLANVLARH